MVNQDDNAGKILQDKYKRSRQALESFAGLVGWNGTEMSLELTLGNQLWFI